MRKLLLILVFLSLSTYSDKADGLDGYFGFTVGMSVEAGERVLEAIPGVMRIDKSECESTKFQSGLFLTGSDTARIEIGYKANVLTSIVITYKSLNNKMRIDMYRKLLKEMTATYGEPKMKDVYRYGMLGSCWSTDKGSDYFSLSLSTSEKEGVVTNFNYVDKIVDIEMYEMLKEEGDL